MHAASLVLALIALTPAQGVTESLQDARITARIETMFLMNDHLSPFNIITTTSGGAVTLAGSVSDDVQRELAGELAASVDGVMRVDNQITVVPAYSPVTPPRTFRQRIDDLNTAASIKRRLLAHGEFKGLKIGVKAERAIVTLYGVVGTGDQRARIEAIAAETAGVARVDNNLTVRPKNELDQVQNLGRQVTDEWSEKRVESALLMNQHVRVRDLNVEVDDGVCVLTGLVDTSAQRDLAASIAENVYSAGPIRNDIRVREPSSSQDSDIEEHAAPDHAAPLEFMETEPAG